MTHLGPYELDRVHLGDCIELMKALPDKCVDCVVTDPPYGIDKAEWDKEYPSGFEHECLRVAKTVVIMPGQWAIPICISNLGDSYLSIIALHNRNGMTFSPLGFGNWIPCIVAGNRPKSGQDLLSFTVDGKKNDHPSPKPIRAMLKLIDRITNEDAVILDPFSGSGTTGVAAIQTGRRFLGFEIDPRWCNLANKRIEAAKAQQSLDLS